VTTGNRPVVWISHRSGEPCVRCGSSVQKGQIILIDRQSGLRCAACGGLGDLVFLPSGDAALTRRALAHSARSALVVKFARARGRHERQGVLVEPAAIERAEAECAADATRREAERGRRRVRDEAADRAYIARFAERVRELFPGSPPVDAEAIAQHACAKYSGRVGRSSAAKALDPDAIRLAVRAHIRHRHTPYDDLLAAGREPAEARSLVRERIEAVLRRWEAPRSTTSSERPRPGSPPAPPAR
jgi:hypothetical protein